MTRHYGIRPQAEPPLFMRAERPRAYPWLAGALILAIVVMLVAARFGVR